MSIPMYPDRPALADNSGKPMYRSGPLKIMVRLTNCQILQSLQLYTQDWLQNQVSPHKAPLCLNMPKSTAEINVFTALYKTSIGLYS